METMEELLGSNIKRERLTGHGGKGWGGQPLFSKKKDCATNCN